MEEKMFEVTFPGSTMDPEGDKKIMSETQVRQSRIFTDTFSDMIFRLQVNEAVYHHETRINYKRTK